MKKLSIVFFVILFSKLSLAQEKPQGRGLKTNSVHEENFIRKEWKEIDPSHFPHSFANPAQVDNSVLPSFPPIASQGSQNSCVSWAITYYQLSHAIGMAKGWNNKTSDLSMKFSPKWSYNMVNGGADNGSSSSQVYKMLQYHGALNLIDRPYDLEYRSWPTDTNLWRKALVNRIDTPQIISSLSTDTGMNTAKTILASGYVLTFGTYIDSWQYQTVKDNPLTNTDDAEVGKSVVAWQNGSVGGHMMTIVGYNDDLWTDINGNGTVDTGELGAFRVANSWGTNWKDKGFIWITYDAFKATSAVSGGPSLNRVGLSQNDRAYHIIPKLNYQPRLTAEINLAHDYRNQITISLGSSGLSSTTPTTTLAQGIMQAQGGAYAFDGGTSKINQRFVLDMTDLIPANGGDQKYFITLTDTDTGTSVDVTDFVLVDNEHLSKSVSADGTPTSFASSTKNFGINWNQSTGSAPTIDTTAPQVSVTYTRTSSNYVFNATASDQSGISKVAFYLDGRILSTDTTAPYSASMLLKKMTAGLHFIEAIATDNAGNSGSTGRISFSK